MSAAESLDDLLGRYRFGRCRDCQQQQFDEFKKGWEVHRVRKHLAF